jgi:hypothetical protein
MYIREKTWLLGVYMWCIFFFLKGPFSYQVQNLMNFFVHTKLDVVGIRLIMVSPNWMLHFINDMITVSPNWFTNYVQCILIFFPPVLQPSMSTEATSPLFASSGTKRKRPPSSTKRFKPPMAKKLSPVVMRSPMMRLVVSPLVVRPRSLSLSPQRSPSRSPWRSPSYSPWRSLSRSPRSGAAHSGSHDHGNYEP